MGGREYFIGPTGKREQMVKDLDALMKEVKKYARFDKVLVQAVNGEPVSDDVGSPFTFSHELTGRT